jgi:hypothetical protein
MLLNWKLKRKTLNLCSRMNWKSLRKKFVDSWVVWVDSLSIHSIQRCYLIFCKSAYAYYSYKNDDACKIISPIRSIVNKRCMIVVEIALKTVDFMKINELWDQFMVESFYLL